jgi:RNA polymerase sigma factor (sigma-70 family)
VDRVARDEIVALYDAFFEEVYAYCAFRLYSKDLAEDATAAVFLRLVEKYEELNDRCRAGVRSWLYGTASNVVAKHLRDVRRRREIVTRLARERELCHSERPAAWGRSDWPVVHEAICRLSRPDQDIITMRYFGGLDSAAIAQALGIARITARVRLSRAIKGLRKQLGKAYG